MTLLRINYKGKRAPAPTFFMSLFPDNKVTVLPVSGSRVTHNHRCTAHCGIIAPRLKLLFSFPPAQGGIAGSAQVFRSDFTNAHPL